MFRSGRINNTDLLRVDHVACLFGDTTTWIDDVILVQGQFF